MSEKMATLNSKLELLAKTGSFVAGFNEVYRLLLKGKLECVIYVRTLPNPYLTMLKNALELSKTPSIVYEEPRSTLGRALNLKYPVAVLGIVNQGESKILEETKKHAR